MTADGATSPKYDSALVEHAVLLEIIDLHPDHLTEQELTLRIGADQEDFAEVEAIKGAIRSLGSSGLVRRIGEVIAPTHAALRAATIFNQFP